MVDLQELLRTSPVEQLRHFSERVEVERKSTPDGTYVVFSSRSGYEPSMQSIKDADLAEPDALAALDGSELYQRRYRTPDPYWAKTVRKDWEPKPIKWIVSTFFGDHAHVVESNEEYELIFRCKDETQRSELCGDIGRKLEEMGITARATVATDGRHIVIAPAAAGAAEVIAFCQKMLGIEETNTFVFGSEELVESCVRGKGNIGICGSASEGKWESLGARVYVSKANGAEALLDGILHHAVF